MRRRDEFIGASIARVRKLLANASRESGHPEHVCELYMEKAQRIMDDLNLEAWELESPTSSSIVTEIYKCKKRTQEEWIYHLQVVICNHFDCVGTFRDYSILFNGLPNDAAIASILFDWVWTQIWRNIILVKKKERYPRLNRNSKQWILIEDSLGLGIVNTVSGRLREKKAYRHSHMDISDAEKSHALVVTKEAILNDWVERQVLSGAVEK